MSKARAHKRRRRIIEVVRRLSRTEPRYPQEPKKRKVESGKLRVESKIISKTIKIKCDKLPPEVDFIENQIKLQGLNPVRWAIVEVNNYELTLSVSGYEIY